jgi:hypothetical protein
MKRAFVLLLVLAAACNGTITVVVPYCPVSDTAKAKADSVPFTCVLAATDTTKRKP